MQEAGVEGHRPFSLAIMQFANPLSGRWFQTEYLDQKNQCSAHHEEKKDQ